MNKEIAHSVLNGLVERASLNRKGTFLSEIELEAIQFITGVKVPQVAGVVKSSDGDTDQEITSDKDVFEVKWTLTSAPDHETRICIDFGTSFSKAFACKGDDPSKTPELIDIVLSENAQGSEKYLLPSELLIHDGKIHFGRSARLLFEELAAEQDRLIDNFKQFITLSKSMSHLSKRRLSDQKDPTGLFFERDALVLYLSHLIRMVDASIQNMKIDSPLLTRYTHPAWAKKNAADNALNMKRIVAESMALAKSYPSDFLVSLDAGRASKLLAAARSTPEENLPLSLLEDPVLEATAAGAGALMDARPVGRQHYVVLDIGAGTTDVAGCICVKRDEDHVKVWEIKSARGAKNLAGNMLDNALRKCILENSSLAKGSLEYEQSDRALKKNIRSEKEKLFQSGGLFVELVTNETVKVDLAEFLADLNVRRIFSVIHEMVKRAAFAVSEDKGQVFLVPTGGGATLPIVKELTAIPLEMDGRRVKLKLADAMPELLREAYPNIEPFYPQLAVSIGGAQPALPEQMASLDYFGKDPGKKTLAPVYKS